jgi:hypothetical protein
MRYAYASVATKAEGFICANKILLMNCPWFEKYWMKYFQSRNIKTLSWRLVNTRTCAFG